MIGSRCAGYPLDSGNTLNKMKNISFVVVADDRIAEKQKFYLRRRAKQCFIRCQS